MPLSRAANLKKNLACGVTVCLPTQRAVATPGMAKIRAPPPPNPSRAAPAAGESTRWFQLPLTRTAVKASSRYNSLLPPHSRSPSVACASLLPQVACTRTVSFTVHEGGQNVCNQHRQSPLMLHHSPPLPMLSPKKIPGPSSKSTFPEGGGCVISAKAARADISV